VNHSAGPIISPAAAAQRAGLPVWAVHMLLRRRVLQPILVKGRPRVSARELEVLLTSNRPEEAA
jgi:hypothetical protein